MLGCLLAGCAPGLCITESRCGIGVLEAVPLEFGSRTFASRFDAQLVLTNRGVSPATGISATQLSAPFAFRGGGFPGTDATCSETLGPGESCTLALTFEVPSPPAMAHAQTLTLSYYNGDTDQTLEVTLNGSSDNGVFNATGAGFTGFVYSVAPAIDDSGAAYAGGILTSYHGTAINNIVRMRFDGSLDTGFATGSGLNNWVSAVAPARDGSGDIYAGGIFTAYNGTANKNYIIRLNRDGSVDTAFDIGSGASAGFNGEVLCLTAADDGSGDIYAGGWFTSYRGTTNINRIVRLNNDGSVDTGFNIGAGASAGVNSDVYAIALASDGSGDLYVGGNFTAYRGATNTNRIVRINSDGSQDSGLNIGSGASAGFNAAVRSLGALSDGDVYVGGDFTSYNGAANTNRILRLNNDGSIDGAFNIGSGVSAGFGASVRTLINAADGDLYVGGWFSSYQGTSNINFIARLNDNGSLDAGFNLGAGPSAGFDNYVYSIASAQDGTSDLYAAGMFSTYQGSALGAIARIGTSGVKD